jgi:hypothetical protein
MGTIELVPNYRWMYAWHPQAALGLRSDYRSSQRATRLHLAELLARGAEEAWGRAEELYSRVSAQDLDRELL